MPRGGARQGPGRPPGSRGETAKIIQQAAEDGVLPLKIMLDNLRIYTKQADELTELLDGGVPAPTGEDGAANAGEARAAIIEAIGQVVGLRKLAGEEAARAAPYCHPRQGVLAEEGGTEEMMPLADRIAYYTRRDEIAVVGDNVVELKPCGDQSTDPGGSL
ncbi:MAG: hypothetical protein P4L80_02880 [Xanthobacteraceae bacterium]|nr:hypothetical protein [Xanthobacteraceae bacterium]